MRKGYLADPAIRRIVNQGLRDAQHRNPSSHPAYFTTGFFHHANELHREILDSGLDLHLLAAVEGPAWLLSDLDEQLNDKARREQLMGAMRWIEAEPSLLGASAHMMAIAHRAKT